VGFLAATHTITQEVTRGAPARRLLVIDETSFFIDLHLPEAMLNGSEQILPPSSHKISPIESAGPADLRAEYDVCPTTVHGCTTHVTAPLADVEDSRVRGIHEKHLREIDRSTAYQETVSIIGDTQQCCVTGTAPAEQSTLSIKINADHGPSSIYRRLKSHHRSLSGERRASRILKSTGDSDEFVADKIQHVQDRPLVLGDHHRETPPIAAQRDLPAICRHRDSIQPRPITLTEHHILGAP